MKKEFIITRMDDDTAIITINRPPLNALSSEAYGELYEAFYEVSKNEKVKVVILTGAGEKAFVAGADITEFMSLNHITGPLYTRRNNSIREYIRQYEKPVICAVNGLAYGGGCALALVCDIKIASEHAKFNLAEINMGIVGATQYVANIAHYGAACKLVFTGEPVDAAEALRIGLIDEIVPKDRLMERSIELAKRIASKPPMALRMAKKCMIQAQQGTLDEGLRYEESILSTLWGSEDKNEAVRSFLEKRKPVFSGK
jgi:enoyl-CoA hydratase